MTKKLKGNFGSPNKAASRERRKPRKATNASARTAVAPPPAASDQATMPSYKVYNVAIAKIKVVGKRRAVDPKKVQELADSIPEIGLRTPLTVRKAGNVTRLITGLHRLEAARRLGWEKVPVVYIKGGKKVARLWEISENLHRAELTVMEESELISEWLTLTGAAKALSAQNGQKGKSGRPKGGMSDAARNLPGKGTESAKRHKITRAAKIAGIDADVKRKIADAGFADSQLKLIAIASEPDKEAQLRKLQQLKAGRHKADAKSSNDSSDAVETPFDLMARQWLKEKKLSRPAWERAAFAERTRFIVEVLKHPLDGK